MNPRRMADWITTGERPLPFFVSSFAKPASGSSNADNDSDDDDDDEDDEDDEDEDADKSEDDLRAELKAVRVSLKGTSASDAKKRAKIRKLNAELEEARRPKPKPKADADGDEPLDVEQIRDTARREGEAAATLRAKKAEAKASLRAAGVPEDRLQRALNGLDLDELDLDDEGLDGIDDAIAELKRDVPEFFSRPRKRRESVAGGGDRDGDAAPRGKAKTASEKAAAQLLRR